MSPACMWMSEPRVGRSVGQEQLAKRNLGRHLPRFLFFFYLLMIYAPLQQGREVVRQDAKPKGGGRARNKKQPQDTISMLMSWTWRRTVGHEATTTNDARAEHRHLIVDREIAPWPTAMATNIYIYF